MINTHSILLKPIQAIVNVQHLVMARVHNSTATMNSLESIQMLELFVLSGAHTIVIYMAVYLDKVIYP